MKKEIDPFTHFLSVESFDMGEGNKREDQVVVKQLDLSGKFYAHEFLADYQYVAKKIDQISGRVYTLIDASFEDQERREAMKDTIRGIVSVVRKDTYTELTEDKAHQRLIHSQFESGE